MVKYIVNRILVTIPIIIAIILIVFLLLQVLPGNPIQVMMKEKANQAVIDRVTEQMGLNDPLMVRFGRYLWGMLHGDLGHSYKLKRPVTQLIMTAFPNTVKLAITSALVAWIIGIPTGIISAGFVEQYTKAQGAQSPFDSQITTMRIDIDSIWIGKTVSEIESDFNMLVLIARRGDTILRPYSRFRVELGDILGVYARPQVKSQVKEDNHD